jgi:hypothetical protein
MLPKYAKHRYLLASSILAALFLLAYYFGALSPYWDRKSPYPTDTEVVRDSKIRISADTTLVEKIIYLKCHDEEVFRAKPTENQVGMNIRQVQQAYSGWTIDKFDQGEVVMSLKVDSYCREHANNTFIGEKDGFVAVYRGRPGPKAILEEVTRITLGSLNATALSEIHRGMVVKSREELLRTLEGLESR